MVHALTIGLWVNTWLASLTWSISRPFLSKRTAHKGPLKFTSLIQQYYQAAESPTFLEIPVSTTSLSPALSVWFTMALYIGPIWLCKNIHISPKVPIEMIFLKAGDVVMFRYRNEPVDGLRDYKVLMVNPTKKWEPLTVECDCEGECYCFDMLQTNYTIFKVGNVLQSATTWGKLDTYFLIESNMKETSTIKIRLLKKHKKIWRKRTRISQRPPHSCKQKVC